MRLTSCSLQLVAAFATVGFVGNASAFCQATTCADLPQGCESDPETGCEMNGPGVSWHQGCVSYAIQADGSSLRELSANDLEEALGQAASAWLSADCGGEAPQVTLESLGTVECGAAEYNPSGQNMNVWVFRDSGWPYEPADMGAGGVDTAALAYTTLTYEVDSGKLLDADVEINSQGIPITKEVSTGSFDLRTIVTHEMGHFLGLDHSKEAGAVMTTIAMLGEPLHELGSDDIAGVCSLYSQAPYGPPGCAPSGGFSEECGADQEPAPEEKSGCQWSAAPGNQGRSNLAWFTIVLALALTRRMRPTLPQARQRKI